MSEPMEDPATGIGNLSPIDGRREGSLRLPGHPEAYAISAERTDDKTLLFIVKKGTWIAGRCTLHLFPAAVDIAPCIEGEISLLGMSWAVRIENPTKGAWEVRLCMPRKPWGRAAA